MRAHRHAGARRWAWALLLASLSATLDTQLVRDLAARFSSANARDAGLLARGRHLWPTLPGAAAFGLSRFIGGRRTGIREGPLWTIDAAKGHSVSLADDLTDDEAEAARGVAIRMLATLYERDLLPFKTKNYARTKGVFDRVPLEQFMAAAAKQLQPLGRLSDCLEWGPYFKRWPNVTQPYMRMFNCDNQWTFHHDTKSPRVRTLLTNSVYGMLDARLSDQGLDEVKNKFDLVIIPQTLQYVTDPDLSMSVLYDMVKPGGFLVFTTPFLQTVMPYPTDYYRFTVEGNELLLKKAGFQVVKSYVGGDDFWALCWIMHCGVSDLTPAMAQRALREAGSEYSRNAYMLSAQLARKPDNTDSRTG